MLSEISQLAGNWTVSRERQEQLMPRIQGDDGLVADDVGYWATEKHNYLIRYISIFRAARKRFLQPLGSGGATFIDLFCGTGRSLIRETGQWIDGSSVAAWKQSVKDGAPFTNVIISDKDPEAVAACEQRLRKEGAPVTGIVNDASVAAGIIGQTNTPFGRRIQVRSATKINSERGG